MSPKETEFVHLMLERAAAAAYAIGRKDEKAGKESRVEFFLLSPADKLLLKSQLEKHLRSR